MVPIVIVISYLSLFEIFSDPGEFGSAGSGYSHDAHIENFVSEEYTQMEYGYDCVRRCS